MSMSRAKQGAERKRRGKAVPVLGAAGLSLMLASGASAATEAPVADVVTHNAGVSHEITLSEEEISDVSLATFYVFDKENAGAFGPGVIRLAMGAGCAGCAGCGGCGCWTGTYYTSPVFGNDAYPPPRPDRPRTGTFIKSHNGRNPRNYGYRLAGVTRDALEGVVVDLSRSRPRPTVSVRSREGVDPDFKDLLIEPTSAPKVRHALA